MAPLKKESLSSRLYAPEGGDSQTDAQVAQPARKRRGGKFKKFVLLVIVLAFAALAYGYYEKDRELKLIKDPNLQVEAAKKEAETLVAEVGKIAALPQGELPQVYTVQNAAEAIKAQPNLEGVIDGDKVLIYVTAAKAVLYSPSRHLIINILPVVLRDQPNQQAQGQADDNSAKPAATSSRASN